MAVEAIKTIVKFRSKAASSWKVREFERPLLNFDAATYYTMVQYTGKTTSKRYKVYKGANFKPEASRDSPTQPVTVPPLVEGMDLDSFVRRPFDTDIPCHSQATERAVATTHGCVKKRKTEKTQMDTLLSTVASRKENTNRVVKKRYLQDFVNSSVSDS